MSEKPLLAVMLSLYLVAATGVPTAYARNWNSVQPVSFVRVSRTTHAAPSHRSKVHDFGADDGNAPGTIAVPPAEIRNAIFAWENGVPTVAGPIEPDTEPTTVKLVALVAVIVNVSATDVVPPL